MSPLAAGAMQAAMAGAEPGAGSSGLLPARYGHQTVGPEELPPSGGGNAGSEGLGFRQR